MPTNTAPAGMMNSTYHPMGLKSGARSPSHNRPPKTANPVNKPLLKTMASWEENRGGIFMIESTS